jgi:hypothetical protein
MIAVPGRHTQATRHGIHAAWATSDGRSRTLAGVFGGAAAESHFVREQLSRVRSVGKRESGVGQIIGTVGVILSLAFVGYEIRQNTQVARAATVQSLSDQSIEILLAWSLDDEAVDLLGRVLKGQLPADFTEAENVRLRLMYITGLRSVEAGYRQLALSLMGDTEWMGGAAAMYRAPYLVERCSEFHPALASDFAEWFETEYGLR